MSTQIDVDMYKNDMVTRRYSEGFKLKILAELSTGNYSKKQLGTIYGINRTTINEWIKKYDRKDLMNTRIMIENQDEITRIKALQKELDVDFIGSQEPLTSSEEKALSEFFKKNKEIKKQKSLRLRRTTKKVTTKA